MHLPPTGTGPFPVMIYLHSGGWIAGYRSVIPDFLLAQVDRGITLVSIDYRLVTTAPDGSFVNSFPVPDTDVDRAVRFVKAHASTWNLDPRHVMLAGASAGGHLAALAAAAPGVFVDPTLPPDLAAMSPRVQGVLDFVGVSDFSTFGAAGGWAPGTHDRVPRLPRHPVRPLRPLEGDRRERRPAPRRQRPARVPRVRRHRRTRGVDDPGPAPRPSLDPRPRRPDSEPTWTDGVSFHQTPSGHNIDSTELNIDELQTWIAAVIDH